MYRGSDIPRLLAVAGLALLAACSDATGPAPGLTPTLARPQLIGPAEMPEHVRQAVNVKRLRQTQDSVVVDFIVTSQGGWFIAGLNAVYFPPNSICNPATTSYGPTEWDKPCSPANRAVAIRGRAGTAAGNRSWMQFDTDLRFVPSDDPAHWVRIYMWSQSATGARPADAARRERAFNILWVPSLGAAPVDESLADPTLATQVYWGSGIVTRRVKHFSGYQVGEGYVQEEGISQQAW